MKPRLEILEDRCLLSADPRHVIVDTYRAPPWPPAPQLAPPPPDANLVTELVTVTSNNPSGVGVQFNGATVSNPSTKNLVAAQGNLIAYASICRAFVQAQFTITFAKGTVPTWEMTGSSDATLSFQ